MTHLIKCLERRWHWDVCLSLNFQTISTHFTKRLARKSKKNKLSEQNSTLCCDLMFPFCLWRKSTAMFFQSFSIGKERTKRRLIGRKQIKKQIVKKTAK
jgi:hypothetical protein